MTKRAEVLLTGFAFVFIFEITTERVQPNGEKIQMSALDARAALVDLIEKSNDRQLKAILNDLRKAEPKPGKGDEILLDLWQVNLKERTFLLSLVSPPMLLEYSGVFEIDKKKKWTAKV